MRCAVWGALCGVCGVRCDQANMALNFFNTHYIKCRTNCSNSAPIWTQTYTHTYIHIHTHTYIHTYTYTHIHTYIHTLTHVHVLAYFHSLI